MARLEDLNLTSDSVGDDIDYANLPPQDPHYDHMNEAFDDPNCLHVPGAIGEVGASLPVSPSRLIH
jgi:hypothetical protein